MSERKQKDWTWKVEPNAEGGYTREQAMLSTLMDLRDELKEINTQMRASQFCTLRADVDRIERTVRTIDRRLAKKIPLRTKK